MSRKNVIIAQLCISVENKKTGGPIFLTPNDPAAWAKGVSICDDDPEWEPSESPVVVVDTLSSGCGEVTIAFASQDVLTKHRTGYACLEAGKAFGLVCDKSTLLALQRAINFAVENMEEGDKE